MNKNFFFSWIMVLLVFTFGLVQSVAAIPRARPLSSQVMIDTRIVDVTKPNFLGAGFLGGSFSFQEENPCRTEAAVPSDPYLKSRGALSREYDDQWAVKRVGFTTDNDSTWHIEDGAKNPVVVAVIDTGLDWNHPDIDWRNIWKNSSEIADNGIDDDKNGYVDDVIGWNFVGMNNKPWDEDGHGTFVTGIIAAAHNQEGIAGINRGAKIMVLKALNDFGQTRASFLAEAIFYAATNGAQVINLSVGGKTLTRTEQEAVDYARKKGALVVVAAGNEAVSTSDYAPAGLKGVITVAATDVKDKRSSFSNYGQEIDLAAPGIDVLSLRAIRTDMLRGIPGIEYTPKSSYVGKNNRYYRASGTSFSAPMVAATASLLLAKNPKLTNEQVKRMILHSATDVEVTGWDHLTGYGLLNATAALNADPQFYIETRIAGVKVAQKNGQMFLAVLGTIDSDKLSKAWIELGQGESPSNWKRVSDDIGKTIRDSRLTAIAAENFRGSKIWVIKLVGQHENGRKREARFRLELG
jgi:subtilisin family serine protease